MTGWCEQRSDRVFHRRNVQHLAASEVKCYTSNIGNDAAATDALADARDDSGFSSRTLTIELQVRSAAIEWTDGKIRNGFHHGLLMPKCDYKSDRSDRW